MAFAERLIDRMLDKTDPNKALEAKAVNSMILTNDADAVAVVNGVLNDVLKNDSPNSVIVSALERIASKIAV